jgi:3-hydroxyisobutyrate dehydrogenase/glyoxylate/succinic semialdehyde reductase
MKIGFIGLGIMGSRMAANLQKDGNALVLFNRSPAKAEPLLGPCGEVAHSPANVAEQVDILFTMLATPSAVEETALGDNGFLDHLRPQSVWVDCSSVNPSFSKKWPLLRLRWSGQPGAEAREWAIMLKSP